MAEDFTLIFLAELAVGLFVFCLIAAYAYRRIKRFKKDVSHLMERTARVEASLLACRNDLQLVHRDSDSRVSVTELDHALNLFSTHVLHFVPRPRPAVYVSSGRPALKTRARKSTKV